MIATIVAAVKDVDLECMKYNDGREGVGGGSSKGGVGGRDCDNGQRQRG